MYLTQSHSTNKMITKQNVHKFSKHYKEADKETKAIARLLIDHGFIEYSKEEKDFTITCVLPQYKIKWDKKFVCSCGVENCPHILALFMQLKIWSAEKTEKIKKDVSLEKV